MNNELKKLQVTEQEVVQYLTQRPDFFIDHSELLTQLHLKHDSGDAISLIERQNHILRQQNIDLVDRLEQFIDVAQRNDRLFFKLQDLVIKLLPCHTTNQICRVLNTELKEQFDVDEVQLVLNQPHHTDSDLWQHFEQDNLLAHFGSVVSELKNQCGEFDQELRDRVFVSGEIKSLAMAAICRGERAIGVLVLGSQSKEHYRSSTDTLFLGHLAKVVSQLLDRC